MCSQDHTQINRRLMNIIDLILMHTKDSRSPNHTVTGGRHRRTASIRWRQRSPMTMIGGVTAAKLRIAGSNRVSPPQGSLYLEESANQTDKTLPSGHVYGS